MCFGAENSSSHPKKSERVLHYNFINCAMHYRKTDRLSPP